MEKGNNQHAKKSAKRYFARESDIPRNKFLDSIPLWPPVVVRELLWKVLQISTHFTIHLLTTNIKSLKQHQQRRDSTYDIPSWKKLLPGDAVIITNLEHEF